MHRPAHARARRALTLAPALLLAAAVAPDCQPTRPPALYPITLRVVTDQRAMPGAQVFLRDRLLGATDLEGAFRMRMTGMEGAVVEITVRCPNGFTSPAQPVPITLRSAIALDRSQASTGIETTVRCPPSQRIAAVVVRAPNRGNLPVIYQGHEITRTDSQGVAHMIFRVAPNDTFGLRLDTSAQPLLRPENPTLTVTTRDADDVYVVTQNFDEAAPPRRPTVRRGPVRIIPIRIPSRRGNLF